MCGQSITLNKEQSLKIIRDLKTLDIVQMKLDNHLKLNRKYRDLNLNLVKQLEISDDQIKGMQEIADKSRTIADLRFGYVIQCKEINSRKNKEIKDLKKRIYREKVYKGIAIAFAIITPLIVITK